MFYSYGYHKFLISTPWGNKDSFIKTQNNFKYYPEILKPLFVTCCGTILEEKNSEVYVFEFFPTENTIKSRCFDSKRHKNTAFFVKEEVAEAYKNQYNKFLEKLF